MSVHRSLVRTLQEGLKDRVARGIDTKELTQLQLSTLTGVPQGNISAILRGRPTSEATWQKLMDAAWPDLEKP